MDRPPLLVTEPAPPRSAPMSSPPMTSPHMTPPPKVPHRRRPRPHDRPTLWFRLLIGLAGIGSVAFNVALMISDRAPSFTKRVFGDFASRLSNRLDADRRAQAISDNGLPEGDAIVHIGVWGLATLLVALTIWSWRGILLAAVVVFAASLFVEVAQGRYSSSRNVEARDAVSNATGVILGSITAGLCLLTWSACAAVARRVRTAR